MRPARRRVRLPYRNRLLPRVQPEIRDDERAGNAHNEQVVAVQADARSQSPDPSRRLVTGVSSSERAIA